ncbi:MAG: RNA polymerase sigma factor SigI [Pseudonocardiales bacterium]
MAANENTRTRATEAQFDETWRAHRPYLINLAYGMLRDIGAAEDAVQEGFARFAAADYPRIADARGWLIVVTGRVCLDQIQSARSRRERSVETGTIEFVGAPTSARPVDPADRVTLDDEVRIALLVVLDALTPAERVVFVMHDVFRTPFDEIAQTVGRSVASCRQMARRARSKIEKRPTGAKPAESLQARHVVDQFIETTSNGDIAALAALLDPGVWGVADMGPDDPRTDVPNHGGRKVSRNLMRWFTKATLVVDPAGDDSQILAFVDRKPYAVIALNIVDGLIRNIRVTVDPDAVSARP